MPAVFGNVSFLMIHVSLVFIGYILYVVLRMKEKTQLHYAFLFLMFSVFLWVLGAIFLAYDDLYARGTRAAWVYLSYIGLILTPMAILYLGLTFSQSRISLSWKTLLLWVVPVVSIVVLLTNERHHLFYRYLRYEDLTQARALGSKVVSHLLFRCPASRTHGFPPGEIKAARDLKETMEAKPSTGGCMDNGKCQAAKCHQTNCQARLI